MATALRKPVGHEDRLSLVEHLDELRSRLIICVVILGASFTLCAWQNGRLLDVINKPLDKETQKDVENGRGALGQIDKTAEAVRNTGLAQIGTLDALARDPSVALDARRASAGSAPDVAVSLKKLPLVTGNKPVTL